MEMDWKKYFKIPPNPMDLELARQRSIAMQARLAGLGWNQIAELLGISPRWVYNLVMKDLRKVGHHLAKRAKELHTLEWSRLEAMTTALYPKAMNGEVKAVETMLKIMERRAKMMGLDAPERVETKNHTVTFSLDSLSDQEIRLRAEQLGLLDEFDPDSIPGEESLPGLPCYSGGFEEEVEDAQDDMFLPDKLPGSTSVVPAEEETNSSDEMQADSGELED